MLKTAFEDLVDIDSIGKYGAAGNAGAIFSAACAEELAQASLDDAKTLLLAVDMQHDFMDGGVLGVKGALCDVKRLTRFIYDNIGSITEIAVTIDTHSPQQIFHPCWWQDAAGEKPAPFTIITAADAADGKWRPVYEAEASLKYLDYLENSGKKQLCIWPYHCIGGTEGCALETQFANMAYFYSIARGSALTRVVKGTAPATEFYGALKPEYSPAGAAYNRDFTERLKGFDRIVIAGEAKDYCVYETLKQILEELEKEPSAARPEIFVLSDCTSSIQPEAAAAKLYEELAREHSFRMVKSTDNFLSL